MRASELATRLNLARPEIASMWWRADVGAWPALCVTVEYDAIVARAGGDRLPFHAKRYLQGCRDAGLDRTHHTALRFGYRDPSGFPWLEWPAGATECPPELAGSCNLRTLYGTPLIKVAGDTWARGHYWLARHGRAAVVEYSVTAP